MGTELARRGTSTHSLARTTQHYTAWHGTLHTCACAHMRACPGTILDMIHEKNPNAHVVGFGYSLVNVHTNVHTRTVFYPYVCMQVCTHL